MPWYTKAVNYQINLRSLAAREPRNAFEAVDAFIDSPIEKSALAYVTQNLEKLQQLGVNLLHLMPPFSIGKEGRKGIGSPYAVRDYFTVEEEYGTNEDLAELIEKAHALNFRILLGIVPNHTARDNVWVAAHPEYYIQDKKSKTPAYDFDWSDTAKLNYHNRGLRNAMFEVYDYWLGFLGGEGVDGFRIDMAHMISDLSFWDETLPILKEKYADRQPLFLAECYGFENNMELFKRGMNAAYDDDFYKIAEVFYARNAEGSSCLNAEAYKEEDERFTEHYSSFAQGGLPQVVTDIVEKSYAALQPFSEPIVLARYTDNHDEGRGIFRFGEEGAQAINALIFTLPDTLPFLLTGQEFGAANRPSIHERIGTCDKGYKNKTADKKNQPLELKEGIEFEGNLFARGAQKRAEIFTQYQQLIALRLTHPALATGTLTWLDPEEKNAKGKEKSLIAYKREKEGQSITILVNLGDETRSFKNKALCKGNILFQTHETITPNELLPFSALIIAKN